MVLNGLLILWNVFFRVKKDHKGPKAWTDSKEILDSVGGKAPRESGVILVERCCLNHYFNPLPPRAFCQECIFGHLFLGIFRRDYLKSTQNGTCNYMAACLSSTPLTLRFMTFLLGNTQKSKFRLLFYLSFFFVFIYLDFYCSFLKFILQHERIYIN